jgi:rhamnulose-1-phosphate aldolase
MSIQAPFPELEELLQLAGEAGERVCEIEASEGAAGNISIYMGWSIDPRRRFPNEEIIPLPQAVPELAGHVFIATGSGRRLREIIQDPAANMGVVVVNPGGTTGTLYTSPRRLFANLTSEFNSHLAVHYDQVLTTGTNFQTVIHAQPPHLTYLSNVPAYHNEGYLNTHILRWQPELIVNLPEGVGLVPFAVPGSMKLMQGTVESLRSHRVVIWAKHGAIARSDQSVKRAVDRIEKPLPGTNI